MRIQLKNHFSGHLVDANSRLLSARGQERAGGDQVRTLCSWHVDARCTYGNMDLNGSALSYRGNKRCGCNSFSFMLPMASACPKGTPVIITFTISLTVIISPDVGLLDEFAPCTRSSSAHFPIHEVLRVAHRLVLIVLYLSMSSSCSQCITTYHLGRVLSIVFHGYCYPYLCNTCLKMSFP